MPADLMPIPRPHLLLLEKLLGQRAVDIFYGSIGWRGAIPAGLEGIDAKLLFIPLLERGLIENCAAIMKNKGGEHFVRLTDLGATCLAYGYMPMAQRPPSNAELIDMITYPPSPTRYLEGEFTEVEKLALEVPK